MKRSLFASLTAALLATATLLAAEPPEMPKPTPEHQWLQKYVGEWENETEIYMDPAQPPMKTKSTESVRSLGGFWVVAEGKGDMGGHPFASVLTIGYDPAKKKYIGTWVDSFGSNLWQYEGTVDASGNILTLATQGPCPMQGGKISDFREVSEFKSPDHRIFTSSVQGEDGQWRVVVKVESRRKK